MKNFISPSSESCEGKNDRKLFYAEDIVNNTDLDADGREDAEVALLHAHEDQLEIVEVGRGQRQGAGEVLDRVRFCGQFRG